MHKYLQMFFRRIKFYNDLKDFYIHISHEILTIIQQKIQHIIENIHNIINKLDKEANNIRQTLKVFHETSEDFKVYQNDTPQIDPAQYDITPIIHMLDTFFKNDVEELSSSYKSLPCQKLNELAYSRYAKTDLKLKILKLAGVNVRGRKDINHLVISSNGELAVTCEENLVKYWNIATKRKFHEFRPHENHKPYCLAVSHNAKYLVTADKHLSIKIWNIKTKSIQQDLSNIYPARVNHIFITNNDLLGTADFSCSIKLWNLDNLESPLFKRDEVYKNSMYGGISCIFINNNNDLLAVGEERGGITVYNIPEDQTILNVKVHLEAISSMIITNDNNYLISGSVDKTIRIWNLTRRSFESVFSDHNDAILFIMMSNDDKQIATFGKEKKLIIYNLERKQKVEEISSKNELFLWTENFAEIMCLSNYFKN